MENLETRFDYQSVPLKFPQKFCFVPFCPPPPGLTWPASPPGVGLLVTGGTRRAGKLWGTLHNQPAAGAPRSKAHAAGGQAHPAWDLSCLGARFSAWGYTGILCPDSHPLQDSISQHPPPAPQVPTGPCVAS